jgi:hypothetical protein
MTWTKHEGRPVYWLAPEFWDPTKGLVNLTLPGENAHTLSTGERVRRKIEFLKLQGDPRYCDTDTAARMKRLMRERLGTDTPWRGVDPVNAQEPDGIAHMEGYPDSGVPSFS